MKAEIGTYAKDRQILHDIVPLETPLLVDMHVSNVCNFRCNYCIQSSPLDEFNRSGLRREFMSWETFTLAVEQLKEFPRKIKTVDLVGIGEPLLHKQLPEMIRYLKAADVADSILVITNASLLTRELGQQLVDAGLDILRISLQGLTAQKYQEISDVKLDWDEFYDNIKYFSQIRGNCKLKVKIADTALEEGDEEKFYALFGDVCDAVAIEHICDQQVNFGKDYSDVTLKPSRKTRYGHEARHINTCYFPFIRMDMRSDGLFGNCCSSLFGFEKNIREETIYEQWNGKTMNQMRADFLNHCTKSYEACHKCTQVTEMYHPEDVLDGYEEEILARMREKGLVE